MEILRDHISKEMNELNLIRCHNIPRGLGADWLCLPDEKVTNIHNHGYELSTKSKKDDSFTNESIS